MSRFTLSALDRNDVEPASFSAVALTTSVQNLWTPSIWTPILADEVEPGSAYLLTAGGTMTWSTTGTAIAVAPYWGQSATPASNVSLGQSSTRTLQVTGATNSPWFARFVFTIETFGAAGSGIGTGFLRLASTSSAGTVILYGGTSATIDTTTNQGLVLAAVGGVSSTVSVTTQFAYVRSLN